MLLLIKVEGLNSQVLIDMAKNKDVTVTGKGVSFYFDENNIKELEEKARKYDEIVSLGKELITDESALSKIASNPEAFLSKYGGLI